MVAIEASQEPSYFLEQKERRLHHPRPASSWSGRQEVIVPGGYRMTGLSVGGTCGGGCFDKCMAPPGAFIRVTSADEIGMWERVVDSAPVTTNLAAPDTSTRQRLVVETTGTVDVEVVPTGSAASFEAPHILIEPPGAGASTLRFEVLWYAKGHAAPASPASVTWVARVRQYGFCRNAAAPCAPDPGVALPRVTLGAP